MLKKKQPKELDEKLVNAVNASRNMLMHKGYFVRDAINVDENTVDLIAVREGLIHSERMRMRLMQPSGGGGLGLPPIRVFFKEQARVFGLKGILVSLGSISKQARRYIDKHGLNVFDEKWLSEKSDFEIDK